MIQEIIDLAAKRRRLVLELAGRSQHLCRCGACRQRTSPHLSDGAGNPLSAARGQIDAPRQVLAGRGLLVDRRRDRNRRDFEITDLAGNRLERVDAKVGVFLDLLDLHGHALSRLGGLGCKFLHLRRDYRKSASGFAAARRLDRGVKRQQIGALGD
ncbi:MAG: hypothetical protein EBR34_10550 [Sphingomonadaceae bacterium]|nr:hypothetical protein [Sphingomonadaceae bacterium]